MFYIELVLRKHLRTFFVCLFTLKGEGREGIRKKWHGGDDKSRTLDLQTDDHGIWPCLPSWRGWEYSPCPGTPQILMSSSYAQEMTFSFLCIRMMPGSAWRQMKCWGSNQDKSPTTLPYFYTHLPFSCINNYKSTTKVTFQAPKKCLLFIWATLDSKSLLWGPRTHVSSLVPCYYFYTQDIPW